MNNNDINIQVIAKDLASATIKEVKNQVQGMGDSVEGASFKGNILTGVVAGITTTITSLGASIIQSGIQSIGSWFGGAVDKAVDFEKTMTTLSIVAPRFGVGADEAKKAAQKLGEELRIGVGPAAESLQNLLKSGLNLDQATDLMKRFTNEAITGKSSSISLAQAVSNLSFAYTTGNSALGNLSGISENFATIQQNGLELLRKEDQHYQDLFNTYEYAHKWKLQNEEDAKKELDNYEKSLEGQAKYRGMIELTNLTMGSSAKFTGSFIDKQAQLNFKMEQFQTNIGELLLPILSELYDQFTKIFDAVSPKLQEWAHDLIPKIGTWIKDTIVPEVKKFVDYLTSEQFKKDLKNISTIFREIKDFVTAIVDAVGNTVKFLNQALGISAKSAGMVVSPANLLGSNYSQDLLGTPKIPTTEALLKGLGGIPKYAGGTDYHPGGMALVGERGPELVNLPRGSSVTPNKSQIVNNFYGYDASQISDTINNQIKFGY